MNDVSPTRSVDLQENGIVRESDGRFIGMIITKQEHDELYSARLLVEELKNRVKIFDKIYLDIKSQVEAQGQKGTYDSDEYMRGLYNGLELALSQFEMRAPVFKEKLK